MRDTVRPVILVGKYRLYPRIPVFRHGEYVNYADETSRNYLVKHNIISNTIDKATSVIKDKTTK